MQDIKNHPWFNGIDWDALYAKEVVPPFEPDVSVVLICREFGVDACSQNEPTLTRHTSWRNYCWRRIP